MRVILHFYNIWLYLVFLFFFYHLVVICYACSTFSDSHFAQYLCSCQHILVFLFVDGEQPVVQSRYSIVKATANRAKEIIDARSVEEKIAKARIEANNKEKEKEKDENLMNLPVLVVDDDKTCCESTIATLKEIGITGEWVLSGREAVECCYARHELKNDYFAVILDWKMPEIDGIETARQIRKRIGKEITIIVLTSYEFSEIEEEAKAAGVDAFIAKPLFRSRLTATLRQFTSGRKEKTARNYLEELSESDYTGKRILLVEDNELNREIGVEILQMTGAEVETAENGKIAVEKVEASPKGSYDLVFMDIQMPVMNGYEATAAIRSLPGEKGKLPIVAMTANAFAEDVQLAKNTGMNGHIAKPLDMNKLNDVLENWL